MGSKKLASPERPKLAAADVKLGPLDSKYMETLRKWRNDPRVSTWCRQFTWISDQDQADWYERQHRDRSIRMFAILCNHELAGVCGFTSIDMINRRAEFSLYVDPDIAGLGVGSRALKALFSHGFGQWGFRTIWGESFDGNPAVRLFERLGMRHEGTRRDFYYRAGRFIDAHLYAITSKEWEKL